MNQKDKRLFSYAVLERATIPNINDLKSQIEEFLERAGHHCWKQQTIGVKGRKLPEKSLGVADLLCTLKPSGRHFEIETKSSNDRKRDSQIKHAAEITRTGAIHIFVKSFDEFVGYYNALFLPPKR